MRLLPTVRFQIARLAGPLFPRLGVRNLLLPILLFLLVVAGPARAEPPRVVADIAPVHSLVAQVMDGVGEPALLLPPGASPHVFTLRPSQARALSGADLVVFTGLMLTPWLERPLDALSGERRLELSDVPGTIHRGTEDGHGHDHGDDHDDAHEHAGEDPHAWLDPENARIWIGAISDRLAELDPENADRYRANAAAANARLDRLIEDMTERLRPYRGVPYVVYHDAYRHLESRFGLAGGGAVSDTKAAPAGAQSVSRIRETLESHPGMCIFLEPEAPVAMAEALVDGTEARIGRLDPLGAKVAPGPDHYARTMTALADDIADCVSGN